MILVDKSNATRDYSIEYEERTGKPYITPFPPGSEFNKGIILRAKERHQEYLKRLSLENELKNDKI